MAHGTPDWGVTSGAVTVYQLTDLAELGARLGSPALFDRRGDLIHLEQFAYTLAPWTLVNLGGFGTIQLSTERYRTTPFAVMCTPPNVSAGASGIRRLFSYRPTKNVGAEISFSLGSDVTGAELDLDVRVAGHVQHYKVRYDPAADALQRINADGDWVDVDADPRAFIGVADWMQMKLVVDTENAQYRRLLFGPNEYNLVGAAAQTAVDTGAAIIQVQIIARNVDTTTNDVWFDDFLLTMNEPD
jgi:hypothetical protein